MATASKNKAYLKLSVEKRLALIDEIWKSIQKEWDVGFPRSEPSDEEKAELDALIAQTDADPGDGVDWESARRSIRAELKQFRRGRKTKT